MEKCSIYKNSQNMQRRELIEPGELINHSVPLVTYKFNKKTSNIDNTRFYPAIQTTYEAVVCCYPGENTKKLEIMK